MRRGDLSTVEVGDAAYHRRRLCLGAAVIVIATLCAYLPAMGGGFIWDDDDYLINNSHLRDAAGLLQVWIPGTTRQYYPAVFTSFWIERRLWNLNPTGYHLVNVLLHVANALLVWRLAARLKVPGAWMIGAVFALHPVHVESVAWITERKNVLSGLFYLLAALAYLRFDEVHPPAEPGAKGARHLGWYATALGLFVLALLSKTVTCSLPAALILMMLWQRKRLTLARLLPLLPLFAIGLGLALHTAALERTSVGASGPEFEFTFAQRLLIASNALLFYPWKLLAPWPLIFIYPRWDLHADSWAAYWPVAAIAIIAAAAAVGFARGFRGPLLSLLFFAGTLFPALGFFNVFPMRYSFVADHFQYLASLGVIALVVGFAAHAIARPLLKIALAAVVLVALAALVWQQGWAYQNEETLWRWTLDQNPRAWIAQTNLAKILLERAKRMQTEGLVNEVAVLRDEALQRLARAHDLKPDDEQLHRNLAVGLREAGRSEQALIQFQELKQRNPDAYDMEIGQTLDDLGRAEDAEAAYRRALSHDGFNPDALMLLGGNLMRQGKAIDALPYFLKFVQLHPSDANARLIVADCHAQMGRFGQAIQVAEEALELARAQKLDHLTEQIQRHLADFRAGKAPAR